MIASPSPTNSLVVNEVLLNKNLDVTPDRCGFIRLQSAAESKLFAPFGGPSLACDKLAIVRLNISFSAVLRP
jgi:hypothetical protein